MKKLLTTVTLVLALSAPAWAGTIAQPGYDDPPPPPEETTPTTGTATTTPAQTDLLEIVIALITSAITTP
jgi:hypothetical protein